MIKTRINKKAEIEKELMSIKIEGRILNAKALARKYNMSLQDLDKILEEGDLDVCNKCYDIYKISWGELTRNLRTGLTYCEKCKKKKEKTIMEKGKLWK